MKLWRPFLVGLVLLLAIALAGAVPKPALAQWDDWSDYSWDDWSYDYSYGSWDYGCDSWDYGYSDYDYIDYWSWDYGYDYDYWSYGDYWTDY